MLNQFGDRKLQLARINQLAILIGIAFFVLLGRLWYLQIALGDDLLKQSESNRLKLLRSRAPRGTIIDCKGREIATSKPQFVVTALPEEVKKHPESMRVLCEILQMTPEEIQAIFDNGKQRPGSPARIAVGATLDQVARIMELRMYLPGVSVDLDQIRNYPNGPAVAHIMGKLGEISKEALDVAERLGKDYRPGDYVGRSGIEREYEDYLHGTDGGKQLEVNAFGRVVSILGEKISVPGKTVKLCINRDLQVAGERALGKQVGAVVAIDPRNGAVLAMVSTPAYDPNVFVKKVKIADWRIINNDPRKPQMNRCVGNAYPPGSTFKPLHITAGLIYGKSDFTVSCPGSRRVGGHSFKCWKVHHSGVTFDRAIAESCDVWFYELGLRIGVDRIAKIAREYGIGSETGIDLPYEAVGLMPDTEWKRRVYHDKWYIGETPSVSIGQGAIIASPLQMALAISGVANGGTIYRPHLLDCVLDPAQSNKVIKKFVPEVRRKVEGKPEYFEKVRKAMRLTVTQGTGQVCNMPDVAVAGKTGSAETNGPAHAWFVCFAPVEKPTIAIACIVEHGRHGASAAAPVCRALLDVYYGKKKPSEIGSNAVRASGD